MPLLQRIARSCRRSGNDGGLGLGCEVLTWIDEPVALESVLLVVQLPVPAILRQQFLVRPALHDRQYAWEQDRFVNPGEDLADAAGPKVVAPAAPTR